ncbi:hypothetical protein E2320_017287 [Naja naja]|nr:hypothetical protein E2320_017287 [Naja naja]
MAALKSFAPFDASTETWESYIERFDCFLEASDLVDLTGSRRRVLFLNFCGKQMFDTAIALLAPQPLNSVTWETLMAKLKTHYAPTPSRIARRHAFHRREQAEGETVNQFMVGLRTAALYCEFKELDDALLDQLVCGLKDLQIQRRLLAKPDLTLQLALDEAYAAELSNKSTVEIHGASSPVSEKKTLAVHQEEATEEDVDLTG